MLLLKRELHAKAFLKIIYHSYYISELGFLPEIVKKSSEIVTYALDLNCMHAISENYLQK